MLQPGSYYRTRIQSKLSSDGTGSSDIGAHLLDELFTRVRDALSEKFATDDRFRQCQLPNHQRLHTLSEEFAADSQVLSLEFFALFRQEIISTLITVLEDVFRPIMTQTEGGTSSAPRTEEHPPESRRKDDHCTSGSSTSIGRRSRLYRQRPFPNQG